MIAYGLQIVSVALLGIYTGAMLTEGLVLVPYWRSLPAAEFFAWYGANDARLLRFFGPLTAATVVGAVAAAAASLWVADPGRWPASIAAALAIVCTAMFPLYFEAANASFSAATVPLEELPVELARWATWHWLRTGLSAAALVAGLAALEMKASR